MKNIKFGIIGLMFGVPFVISVESGLSIFIPGDYVIGVLFPVSRSFYYRCFVWCPDIRYNTYQDIQVAEAALFAVDLINKNENILPNTTLGIHFQDYESGDRNSLQFAIQKLLNRRTLEVDKIRCIPPSMKSSNESILIGVITVEDDYFLEKMHNNLEIYNIVQVGNDLLRDKIDEKLPWVSNVHNRLIFSLAYTDMYVTDAIIEVLTNNNWTYVLLVHSNSMFGLRGLQSFKKNAEIKGICIASILSENEIYSRLASLQTPYFQSAFKHLNVIICYGSFEVRQRLFYSLKRIHMQPYMKKRFVVIGVDEWPSAAIRHDPEIQDLAMGEIVFSLNQTYIKDFDDYFLSRNFQNYERNPWFFAFWEKHFNCTLDFPDSIRFDSGNMMPIKCSGEEILRRQDHVQNPKVSYIVKSVFVFAHALHDIIQFWSSCKERTFFSTINYKSSISKVKFDFYGQMFEFDNDHNENLKLMYNIHNFQLSENGSYDYIQVGTCEVHRTQGWYKEDTPLVLKMTKNLMFPKNAKLFQSSCESCPARYGKVLREEKCCWDCVVCGPLQILNNISECINCTDGSMSNVDKTNCIVVLDYVQWLNLGTILLVFVSLLSYILIAFTARKFLKHENTPVVKSSTKELCYIMFFGMFTANLTPFLIMMKPRVITCALTRILPPISFTLIYAALAVKTNRIARILAISKGKFPNMNPRFLSLKAQLVSTAILIVIELLICAYSLYKHPVVPEDILSPSDIIKQKYGSKVGVFRMCTLKEHILLEVYAFVGILIIACTHYAVKTRNLPENFNEAKYIGFAMYATILTDIAFGFIYVESKFKVLAMNLSISINTLVVLIFMFGPKLYIILWAPEKNTRANFVTSHKIRCFIANQEATSEQRTSSALSGERKVVRSCDERDDKAVQCCEEREDKTVQCCVEKEDKAGQCGDENCIASITTSFGGNDTTTTAPNNSAKNSKNRVRHRQHHQRIPRYTVITQHSPPHHPGWGGATRRSLKAREIINTTRRKFAQPRTRRFTKIIEEEESTYSENENGVKIH